MKSALICFGNEESYGLLFVGGELKTLGHQIKFFDAEMNDVAKQVEDWKPDYTMFSPMSTFFNQAHNLSRELKKRLPNSISVFGGHHALADPSISSLDSIDAAIVGPVRGAIQRALSGERGTIYSSLTTPEDMPMPARAEYFRDIPRMSSRYRKVMISRLGCPFNCTYCSSSSGHMREVFGNQAHKRYFMGRRPLETILTEAEEVVKSPTEEIEWVDDDMFCGTDAENWLPRFIDAWKSKIDLPMYVSATSKSSLNISDEVLKQMRSTVNCIGMGVQAIRPSSLKLMGRQWDNEAQMKRAYDRLKSFGYNVNLQCIVGLPTEDPVEDAIDTIKGMQRIGPGSIISCYPLQIYEGTAMQKLARERGYELNPICVGDTNTGVAGLNFDATTVKRIKNICKLATMFVKYNLDERWMRSLIDIDFDDKASQMLSMTRYRECVVDRLGKKGEQIFEKILSGMHLRY